MSTLSTGPRLAIFLDEGSRCEWIQTDENGQNSHNARIGDEMTVSAEMEQVRKLHQLKTTYTDVTVHDQRNAK